jgi:hypothetical protein
VWRQPDLVICRGGAAAMSARAVDGLHWEHHRFPSQLKPRTLAERPGSRRPDWESRSTEPLATVVEDVLQAVGLTSPEPPAC